VHATECASGKASWSVEGNARITSMNDSSITIRATGPGGASVVVAVEGTCGSLTDSLPITFGTVNAVSLGGDTALCAGRSILLDAGPGYTNYRWQDGANGRTYLARGPGIYWVEVTGPDGCTVRDTLQVYPDDRNISVNLGPDTSMCGGAIVVLDAGPGAVRYRWQDGWDGRTYTAYQPGKYWVEVTGFCGSASDTIVVQSLGVPTATSVSFGEPSAAPIAPGTVIDIPIRIDAPVDRASLVGRNYRAVIRFNASVLLPVSTTPHGIIQGDERIITIEDTIGTSDTLAMLRFLVLLGDSDHTALTIDTFGIIGDCQSSISARSGRIAVAICEQGGERLINSTASASLAVHAESPSSKVVAIHYNLSERGRARLSLVDALGRQVKILVDDDPGPGAYLRIFDTGELASGLYFLLLETPTERFVERLPVR
jgi:hypothetical protein